MSNKILEQFSELFPEGSERRENVKVEFNGLRGLVSISPTALKDSKKSDFAKATKELVDSCIYNFNHMDNFDEYDREYSCGYTMVSVIGQIYYNPKSLEKHKLIKIIQNKYQIRSLENGMSDLVDILEFKETYELFKD